MIHGSHARPAGWPGSQRGHRLADRDYLVWPHLASSHPATQRHPRRLSGPCVFARYSGILADMVAFIIVLLVVGLIAGAIARLLVPGRDPIGLIGTIVLGVLGSFVGGFLENLIQYHTLSVRNFHATGIVGSVIGAVVLLLLLRLSGHERGRPRRGRI
jgi:uncharacterized membrane protein YeaQ/YmgE (transglycosylase-associated protein family)